MALRCVLVLWLLVCSTLAVASCREPDMPELPDARMALEQDIIRAQQAVKHYLALQQRYLSCVNSDARHDAAIDRMREMARRFNNLAREYKARLQAADMITDMAWLELPVTY